MSIQHANHMYIISDIFWPTYLCQLHLAHEGFEHPQFYQKVQKLFECLIHSWILRSFQQKASFPQLKEKYFILTMAMYKLYSITCTLTVLFHVHIYTLCIKYDTFPIQITLVFKVAAEGAKFMHRYGKKVLLLLLLYCII